MNKSSRAYYLMPPNLTDSECELDSDSESDVKEGVNLKRQPDPAPRATDYAKINEIGSERTNPLIDYDLTTMIRNEDIDSESYIQVSSNDPRTICCTLGEAQSDDIHPSGRTSSDNMRERSTGIEANSGPCTNRMELLDTCKAVANKKTRIQARKKTKRSN